jgi:hypothetical protein
MHAVPVCIAVSPLNSRPAVISYALHAQPVPDKSEKLAAKKNIHAVLQADVDEQRALAKQRKDNELAFEQRLLDSCSAECVYIYIVYTQCSSMHCCLARAVYFHRADVIVRVVILAVDDDVSACTSSDFVYDVNTYARVASLCLQGYPRPEKLESRLHWTRGWCFDLSAALP